jgi:uncharacterized membrane protein
MLRLFMIVSGSFEALFGLSALVATAVGSAFGVGVDDSVIFLVRVLGAATLGLGIADRACSGPNVVVK